MDTEKFRNDVLKLNEKKINTTREHAFLISWHLFRGPLKYLEYIRERNSGHKNENISVTDSFDCLHGRLLENAPLYVIDMFMIH